MAKCNRSTSEIEASPTAVRDRRLSHQQRDELVVKNLPFVRYVLGNLVGRMPENADLDNLEAAGILGLVEASLQFDATRGVEFRTFAYPRIWGAMIDELRRNSPLPQKVMNKISRVLKAQEMCSPPVTPEALSDISGLSLCDVMTCLSAIHLSNPAPLDCDILPTKDSPPVLASLEKEEQLVRLAHCIKQLSEQQRKVLNMYYASELRLKEIGNNLGLSESRISRILATAERSLRETLEGAEQTIH